MIVGFSNLFENRLGNLTRILAIIILAILILQFLPINVERNLPGFSQSFSSWSLWSVSPSRSLEAALFTFSVLGFFLYVANFDEQQQRGLIRFILLGFLINLIVGVIQLSYGTRVIIDGVLPFPITSALFANENHFSSLVYMIIPLLAWRFLSTSRQPLVFILVSVLVVTVLFAVGSRAGIAISSGLVIFSLIWFLADKVPRRVKLFCVAAIILMVLIALFIGGTGPLFEQGQRAAFFANTWNAVKDHWLTGTGLGSFVLIYPMYEPSEEIVSLYANHAHNDYLELLLEIGVLIIPLIFLYLVQILRNMFISKLSEAATFSILAVLIHSSVDYPLRTMAIAIVFAVLSAIVMSERPGQSSRS